MELNDIVNSLRNKGYSNATALYHGKKLFNEQFGVDKDKYTDEERAWAYQHGFTAEEVRCLNINENNYEKFLPGGYITLLIQSIR